MSAHKVSVFEALSEYSTFQAAETARGISVFCGLVGIAHLATAGCLYSAIHDWKREAWMPQAFWSNLTGGGAFLNDAADCIICTAVGCFILPFLAAMAIRVGRAAEDDKEREEEGGGAEEQASSCCSWFTNCFKSSKPRAGTEPLLQNAEGDEGLDGAATGSAEGISSAGGARSGAAAEEGGSGVLGGGAGEAARTGAGAGAGAGAGGAGGAAAGAGGTTTPATARGGASGEGGGGGVAGHGMPGSEAWRKEEAMAAQRAEHERVLLRHKAAMRWQNLYTGAIVAAASVMQVYTGIKCIGFNYTNEALHGTLMGLGILWVNVLAWGLREVVKITNRDSGSGTARVPEIHPHMLKLHTALHNHYCDVCDLKLEQGKSYRCKLCDFDCCIRCFTRRDQRMAEGVLRGDKGVRKEEALSTMAYFRRALGLARQQWVLFALALSMLALNNATRLFFPHVQGGIIDQVAKVDREGFAMSITLYLITSGLSGLFEGLQKLSFSVIGRRLANLVRNKLFSGMIIQDVAFFDGNSSGQLTSRLSNDASFMVQPVQSMLGNLLSNSILLVGGMVMCFYTSWRLSMLAFTTVGPILHITQIFAAWSQNLNRRIFAALGAANGLATEALGNIRTVKAMSTEDFEANQYKEATKFALDEGVKEAFGSAGMAAINTYLDLGAGVLILWYGGLLAMMGDGRMSAGMLFTYQLYWNMINTAYQGLLDIVTSFTRAAGAAQRVFALMDSMPDIDINVGQQVPAGGLRGEIELCDVRFTYQMRPDVQVIKGLSLHIPAGTTCAFVGRSGSGKSTLVHLMLRFYDPSAGCIRIDNTPLPEWNLKAVHRRMAVVAQDTQLFAGTIYENLAYGLEEGSYTEGDVVDAAQKACALDFINALPDGFMTRVGERGARISGGQKQRIAIARCFLRKAKMLFLDEATSALDAESEHAVQTAIDNLISGGGATVILVAHRLSTVMNAHKIAVMDQGAVAEEGDHEALIAKGGAYARLVQRQMARRAKVVEEGNEADADVVDKILDQLDNAQAGAAAKGGAQV